MSEETIREGNLRLAKKVERLRAQGKWAVCAAYMIGFGMGVAVTLLLSGGTP